MNSARWPLVRLGEVLSKKAEWIDLDPNTDYRQVTVRMWGGGVVLRQVLKGSDIAASSQLRVRAGQFIMSKIDARHGAFGIVPAILEGAVVSQDFPVFETHRDRLIPEFLNWISKTEWFVELCRLSSEGSTNRVRLKEEKFLQHEIPLPPIPDQFRIVKQFDSTNAAIETHRKTADFVDKELAAILRTAFQKIITDSRRARMGDVAPLVRRAIEIDPSEKYTELGVRSFYKGTFHRRTLDGAGFTWQKLFRVHQGDLIFSNLMAWEQAIAIAKDSDQNCVGNHRMLTCEVDPSRGTPNFLLYYFTTEEGFNKVLGASPGSIARNKTLSAEQLPNIDVPLPSLDAQQWFDALQARAAAARVQSVGAASELERLIPAMLHQVF